MGRHCKSHRHCHNHCELKKSCEKNYQFGQCDLPLTISKPGTYCLKENVVLKSNPYHRNAIKVESDNVCIDLCCHELVLDYCYGGGAQPSSVAGEKYTVSNSSYTVRTSGIFIQNHNNLTLKNGTIRGIAKADDLSTKTEWFGIYAQNVSNVRSEEVTFYDLRNACNLPIGRQDVPANNNNFEFIRCKFTDCIGRGSFHEFPGVIIDHPNLGQILGEHGNFYNTNSTGPRFNLTPINHPIVAAVPLDASGPLTNAAAIAGNIALVIRGAVPFTTKMLNCMAAGAVGVVVYNNVPGLFSMAGFTVTITIPAVSISDTDGAALLATSGTAAPIFGWDQLYGESDTPFFGGVFGANQINGLRVENCHTENTKREYALGPYYGGGFFGEGESLFGEPNSKGYCNNFIFLNNIFTRTRIGVYMIPGGDTHGGLLFEGNQSLHVTGNDGSGFPYYWTCCASANCICRSQIIRNNTFKFEDNDGEPMFSTDFIFMPAITSGIVENNTFSMPNSGIGWTVEAGLVGEAGNHGDTLTIRNNTFQGLAFDHISLLDGLGYLIENNNIDGSDRGIECSPLSGFGVNETCVRNNHIHNCETAVLLNGGTNRTFIDSNFLSNNTTAIDVGASVNDTLITLNRFLVNGTNLTDAGTGTVVPGAGTGQNINGP